MGRIGVSGEELGWKDRVIGKNSIIGVVMAGAMLFLPRMWSSAKGGYAD